MYQLVTTILVFLFSNILLCAPAFEIIPLGVYGGVQEGNLSAYLLKTIGSKHYTALDAGTLVHGLEVGIDKQALPHKSIEDILHQYIPTYLLSHPHLDHIAGLLIAQPELREHQTIMARQETLQTLHQSIFNWSVWGNFGDEGQNPHLNFQHYQTIPLQQWVAIPHTDLFVKTFPLSHGAMASSAFLIRHKTDYLLYFGDTGADSIEKSSNIERIWKEIAPLIRNKQLHAIMLECSFLNAQPNEHLFGHLKPSLFMLELRQLAALVHPRDSKKALQGLAVVVTHIKPRLADFSNPHKDTASQIFKELTKDNDLGIVLIKPEQGVRLTL